MVTASDIAGQFNLPHSLKQGRTLSSVLISPEPGFTLMRSFFHNTEFYYLHSNFGGDIGPVPAHLAAQKMNLIEQLSVSNHVDVKNHQVWRTLYGYQSRTLCFEDRFGVTTAKGNYDTIPCHYCGFVLPLDMIEVDHRQPQAHRGAATMKCLHSVHPGFANAGGEGYKAQMMDDIVAHLAGDDEATPLGRIPVKERPWGNWHVAVHDASKGARYKITEMGRTFLTICAMCWGDQGTEKRCLDNYLNLVPACRICNGSGTGKGSIPLAV